MTLYKLLSTTLILLLSPIFNNAQEKGFKEIQLTHTGSDNRYASYNKSGTQIVFESNRDGHWQIYIMDIDGNNQVRLTNSTSNDRRPSWHPFKNKIIFESDRTGTNEIYTCNLENKSVKKMPISLSYNKSFAQFAPNGAEVVFICHDKNNETGIYMCSANGKRLKKIIDNQHINLQPNLSPRGDNLIYFSNKNTQKKNNVIYSYNIITKEQNRLTYFKDHSEFPDWTNIRSSRIVYSAKEDDAKTSDIYIMRNDGTNKIQITYNDDEDILPRWSPNNINLLITGFRNGNYQICKVLLKEPLSPDQKPLD
ncbi:hypothetical protein ACGK9U_11245 [Mariniflexile sp. HNIBRBA6329]|uniref:hypothetical protein n=1 Tax=Mariniflexile sp. HNIBRBA6329 TaxID=3373088 RepID=UPI003745CD07